MDLSHLLTDCNEVGTQVWCKTYTVTMPGCTSAGNCHNMMDQNN